MPKSRSYKFISQNGGIWQLSEKSYAELCAAMSRSEEYNLDDYGTQIVDQFQEASELQEQVLAAKIARL